MRITEALKIINDAPKDAKAFEVTLACGFTPLHLQTFLCAQLQQMLPEPARHGVDGIVWRAREND